MSNFVSESDGFKNPPIGPLGIIALRGCEPMAKRVDD